MNNKIIPGQEEEVDSLNPPCGIGVIPAQLTLFSPKPGKTATILSFLQKKDFWRAIKKGAQNGPTNTNKLRSISTY